MYEREVENEQKEEDIKGEVVGEIDDVGRGRRDKYILTMKENAKAK